jgi:hypothetical protein
MSDWLQSSFSTAPEASALALAWRIATALVLGVAVSALYRWARRGESIQTTFVPTLILLSTLIAMATQIIGDNIARAFSLVGALSVVRFRTVVKDTQDTAFVIFAVVVGMAAGANHLAVALVGLVVVGPASLLLWPPGRRGGVWVERGVWIEPGGTLTLRVGLADGIRARVEAALTASAGSCELISVGTARQGSSLDLTYQIRLRPDVSPAALVSELNGLEGVESVGLKRED